MKKKTAFLLPFPFFMAGTVKILNDSKFQVTFYLSKGKTTKRGGVFLREGLVKCDNLVKKFII